MSQARALRAFAIMMGAFGGVLLIVGMLLELTALSGSRNSSVAATAHVVLALGGLCVLVGIGAAAGVVILVANARHRAPHTVAVMTPRAAPAPRRSVSAPPPVKMPAEVPAETPASPPPQRAAAGEPTRPGLGGRVAAAMVQLPRALPTLAPQSRAYLPVTILAVALLAQLIEAGIEALRLRSSLTEQLARQEAAIDGANKVRNQLSALLSGTNALAASGDANARAVLDELQRQGIKFDAPAPPP